MPEDADIPKLPEHLVKLKKLKSVTDADERRVLKPLHEERKKRLQLNIWWNELASRRRNGRIHMLVWEAASRFAKEERFWIPWSFDFRTRILSISILNPQSANHVNALMEFADGYEIDDKTEHWLSVHVATTRGFSEETFKGRVEWVRNHHREITLVATDPWVRVVCSGRKRLMSPGLTAACKEFYDLFIAKTRTKTHIRVVLMPPLLDYRSLVP